MRHLRCAFVVVVGSALIAAIGCATPVPVLHSSLNQPYKTRCVLRPDGQKLYSSNYVGEGGYKPGSEATITMFSEVRVDMSVNKIPHQMYPVGGKFNTADIPGFIEKYLVEPGASLALDGAEDSARASVDSGIAAVGMTKKQVYMALGPPPEINFGDSTVAMKLETILAANRWVYYSNAVTPFWFQKVMLFTDEKLSQVVQ